MNIREEEKLRIKAIHKDRGIGMYPVTTYSIAGYDPETKEWGIAVQSKFLAVGSLVPYVLAGVGVVASQAKTNSRFGPRAAVLLQQGMTAQEALDCLLKEDEYREIRQVGIVDQYGNSAAHSGAMNYPYSGHRTGQNYSCQGNVLLGPVVLDEMEKAFINTRGDLAHRLITALEAAQNAGGERRGQEGAALIVRKKPSFELMGKAENYIDLRVDQHISPIAELKRLLQWHRVEYSQNHKDKFYPFEGGTRYRLTELLCETGIINACLETGQSLETVLDRLGKEQGITPVFSDGFINGGLVNRVVARYYEMQEEKYAKR